MKRIKYLIASLSILCCTAALAQRDDLTLKLNYSVAAPTGSFKDIIGNTSFKGFGAELMYHINNQISVGLEAGSQHFYEKYPRQLYKAADGSDISAVLSNTIQSSPVMLKGQYTFLADKAIRPYVAIAAGGNFTDWSQYAGEFSNDSKTKFNFAARPEAGIYIPFGRISKAGLSLSAGYNYMPFNYNGISNINSISARAGINIPLD